MARIGQLFGGRSTTDRDGDGDGVDDRAASESRTWRLGRKHDRDHDGVDDRTEARAGDTGTIPPVSETGRERDTATMRRTIDREPVSPPGPRAAEPVTEPITEPAPVRQAPARVSLLATLGLILAVASVLLVLSGPLMGYGLGVAGLALVLSLSGIHATGKRHVAGKTDALLGMILSLGAIVLGVLALTGALSWLGTDAQPVNTVREWLDARFIDRF